MNNNQQFLHLAYKVHVDYENLRHRLLDRRQYSRLISTYSQQKIFFPDENSGKFWDEKFNKTYIVHHMAEYREKIVVDEVKKSSKILNIGVGRGLLERKLLKKFGRKIDYYGTDITNQTILLLRNNFRGWNFLKAKPSSLPFQDESFDCVMLLEVLEHIKPTFTFEILKESKRVLRKGGKLVISVPVNEDLVSMIPLNPNSHMRLYSEQLLKFELTYCGYQIMKVKRISAFSNNFLIKTIINAIYPLKKPNNIIVTCKK